jgi:tRNA-Thr(GGU) m(6)t(6)A37 methyltransferase TsaA
VFTLLPATHVYTLTPIGYVDSPLHDRADAPRQGSEGAPDAWIALEPQFAEAARDLRVGDEVLLLTWLDRGDREVLSVHPRGDASVPLHGVFSTRSPDRPNPVGIHRVTIVAADGATRFRVSELEAIDGTPVIDIKPVLDRQREI